MSLTATSGSDIYFLDPSEQMALAMVWRGSDAERFFEVLQPLASDEETGRWNG